MEKNSRRGGEKVAGSTSPLIKGKRGRDRVSTAQETSPVFFIVLWRHCLNFSLLRGSTGTSRNTLALLSGMCTRRRAVLFLFLRILTRLPINQVFFSDRPTQKCFVSMIHYLWVSLHSIIYHTLKSSLW